MHILVVGGSGHLGQLVCPHLANNHSLRVFDKRPPAYGSAAYTEGDVADFDALAEAVQGMDALIYMAMGSLDWTQISGIASAFDVNVKGLHLALKAAHEADISQVVYTSTMSVYDGELMTRYFHDEALTPDSTGIYGFTKYLGEQVCLNAARLWRMHINVLRLCHPVSTEKWLAETCLGKPTLMTAAEDVVRVISRALSLQAGYQTFMISGDYEHKILNMAKARQLLDWAPLTRPVK